ncbi:hypothetical protein JOF28_001557 [Leucobacter exalbidus]|uniref:Uncharacterized protein n=1 Tax=Leucobacter exalbidus TaxID=662960 RepID=A0A940T0Y3_9MICO|nr:hypothetical protein [Leucobacter exalbidus]MBP1326325.1 hypothetical protein [Leucobacter exalbidus]
MTVDSPLIMSLQVEIAAPAEPHVDWSIGYAPEPDESGNRFLLAHLHVATGDGTADIDVSGVLQGDNAGALLEESEIVTFERQLDSVASLNLLYFTARTAALGALGLIESRPEIPTSAPKARLARLVRADGVEASHQTSEPAEA